MSRFTLNMAVCLGLLASVPALAQKITGDISGTVTDPSGAAVRAATVRAENTATGEKASATTSDTAWSISPQASTSWPWKLRDLRRRSGQPL